MRSRYAPDTPSRGGFAGRGVSTRRAAPALAVVAAVALAASAPATAQTQPFSDTSPDAYYSEAVGALAANGVFDDTECAQAMLCPGEPIDRKTMAVWIVRALDGQDPAEIPDSRFSDVAADSFHGPFIERMAELGVTSGCGDGTGFCPDGTVTRNQMAVFLTRAFELDPGPDPGFSDVAADAWYYNGVTALAASGITAGCGDGTTFCPRRHTTRAQMATFLARATGLVELPQPATATASPYPATIILPDTVVHVDAHGQRHIFTDDFTTDNGTTRAALSPDGRQVAYTTDTALYVVDADGTNKTQLAQGGFASPDRPWTDNPLLTWSPDSTRIAYTTAGMALYIAKADGTSNRELPTISDGYITTMRFKWSFDSNRIAFAVPLDLGDDFNYLEDPVSELFIANADGTDARQIAGLAASVSDTPLDFEWSPDGSRIAYVTPGGPALRVANADGTGAQRVVDSLFGGMPFIVGRIVQWSPDSSRIAACNLDGTLSVITASTGDTVQVSEIRTGFPCNPDDYGGTWVQWSPDSNKIAVATGSFGVLCVISADGSILGFEGYDIPDTKQCASGGQEDGNLAAWSSDSSSIAIAGTSTYIAHIDSTGGTYQLHDIPRLGGSRSSRSIEMSADSDYVGLLAWPASGWSVASTERVDTSDWDEADWDRYDASILRFDAGVFSPDSARGTVTTSDGIALVDLPTGETSTLVDFSDIDGVSDVAVRCSLEWTQAGVRGFCHQLAAARR